MTNWRRLAIAFYILGLIVCGWGASRFESNIEDVYQWLPDDTSDRDIYDRFVQQFGTDDFLVVTWPDCTVTDKRMQVFVDAIDREDDADLVNQAISGRAILKELIQRNRQRPTEIVERFRGIYFGPDGRSSCVMLMLTASGMESRRSTIEFVQRVAQTAIDVSPDELVLAGYPQVGAYGDRVVRDSLRDFVGPSCVISTLVAWACMRHFGLTLSLLAISGLAAGLSVSIVTLTGSKWGGLSSVVPTLAYILTVSGSLHMVNYAKTPGNDRVLYRVFRIGWKPCTLSALTTAAGMLSLCRSDFPAIREFGMYCAGGVIASLICQLILTPVAIDWLRPNHQLSHEAGPTTLDHSAFLDRILPWSLWVVVAFITTSAACGFGLHWLRSDLEVERNFSPQSSVMKNIAWMEDNIGPVEQTELLVTFNDVTEEGFHQRVEVIRDVQRRLAQHDRVETVLSLVAWLPELPKGGNVRSTAARAAYRKRIATARHELADTPYLLTRDNQEVWRISLRFPFMDSADVAALKSELPTIASDAVSQQMDASKFSIQHTGVVLLYYVAQEELIADLYRNFAFAFLTICPLMILVLRSFKQGLIAMIPNVCPAAVGYGMLGWMDYPIDIGMAMTACVALGIAVDDTTHFMLRIQDLQREPLDGNELTGRQALGVAFHQCSHAMFHTTLIAGLGMCAFLWGPLLSMTRFAGLLIVLLVIALLCDLVLLPALLTTTRIVRGEKTTDD